MKSMKYSKCLFGFALGVFTLLPQIGYGQLSKYDKLHCVGKQTFNFATNAKENPSQDKNKDLLVVYSDRDGNKAYADPLAQRVLGEQKMGTPYYVLDENNGFYKVIAASQDAVGKPKGMWAAFHGSKRHLKDSRNTPFVGWIQKDRLLKFGHSFISTANNAPIKFRVGASSVTRLFNLKPYRTADTLALFKDPFFYEKNGQNIVLGQIVYAYKYDESKQAVLISDKPTLNNPSRKVLGWVPSDLVAEVGQNYLYLLTDDKTNLNMPLQSDLLFALNGNREKPNTAALHAINTPLAVWDMEASKMMNIKGGSFSVNEIKRMIHGSKYLNVHLLFFDKDRARVRTLASTLQSISMKIPASYKGGFSITSISDEGNRRLKYTSDYSQWLSFLEKSTSNRAGLQTSGAGFHSAINAICDETPYVKFENNLFIILGTDQMPAFTSAIRNKLAARSAGMLFVQLSGKDDTGNQNFILQAKELLDDNIASYMNFITGYVADPEWDKPSLFSDMSTDGENAYLLDVPKNSVAVGGLLFPKTNGELSNTGFSRILDSIFVHIDARNKDLIASLVKYGNNLGAQRAVPTDYVATQCEKAALSVANLDRCSADEALYTNTQLNDTILSGTTEGYLFDADEMKLLLEGYRDLMPYFTTGIGKKELSILRDIYNKQGEKVNNLFRRDVLSNKSSISDLFYYKVGIPSSDALNNFVRVKDLRMKKCKVSGWNECYQKMYERLVNLEDMFKSDKLHKITIAGTTYYFIPKQEML